MGYPKERMQFTPLVAVARWYRAGEIKNRKQSRSLAAELLNKQEFALLLQFFTENVTHFYESIREYPVTPPDLLQRIDTLTPHASISKILGVLGIARKNNYRLFRIKSRSDS